MKHSKLKNNPTLNNTIEIAPEITLYFDIFKDKEVNLGTYQTRTNKYPNFKNLMEQYNKTENDILQILNTIYSNSKRDFGFYKTIKYNEDLKERKEELKEQLKRRRQKKQNIKSSGDENSKERVKSIQYMIQNINKEISSLKPVSLEQEMEHDIFLLVFCQKVLESGLGLDEIVKKIQEKPDRLTWKFEETATNECLENIDILLTTDFSLSTKVPKEEKHSAEYYCIWKDKFQELEEKYHINPKEILERLTIFDKLFGFKIFDYMPTYRNNTGLEFVVTSLEKGRSIEDLKHIQLDQKGQFTIDERIYNIESDTPFFRCIEEISFENTESPTEERVIRYMRGIYSEEDREKREVAIKKKFGGRYPPYREEKIIQPFKQGELTKRIEINDPTQLKELEFRPGPIEIEDLPSQTKVIAQMKDQTYMECINYEGIKMLKEDAINWYILPQGNI